MTTEMGKTFRSAVDEAAKCAWVCRILCGETLSVFWPTKGETTASPELQSVTAARGGSCGDAVEFPFWQVMRFAAPALMAATSDF